MKLDNTALLKSLQKQLKYVSSSSKFYQEKFKNNINIEKNILDIFKGLPFTTKEELLQDQSTHPPFGSNLCIGVDQISRVHKTSGTTNKPLALALTINDIQNTVRNGAKCFKRAGLRSADTVIHCLNYNMWAGGYTDHQSLENTGAAVIPFGVGNTEKLIDTILWIKPTAIHCTPSYLSKIEYLLKTKYKTKPSDLGLRLALLGAESGLQNKDFRTSIEDKWNFKAVNANYGLSDVLSMFGSECEHSQHLHFTGENIIFPELINPETLELLPIEENVFGELVITNLVKEAQPLIRYRTNDLIKIVSATKCQCGDKTFQFDIVGRTDDMIVIKGVNVFLSGIDSIVNRNLAHLTGHYQLFINKTTPIDKCILKIETNSRGLLNQAIVQKKLEEDFRNNLSFVPEFCFLDEGSLPRTEGKTKKLFKTL